MFIEYEDEEEFHREQIQKNRQALVFVFLLMVGIVFLGDQQEPTPHQARNRGRRAPTRQSNYMLPPMMAYDASVPFDSESFNELNHEMYGFKVIMPPSVWGVVDNLFGDYRVMAHNEFDRPLVMVPTMLDLYRCSWRSSNNDDQICEVVHNIGRQHVTFTNPPGDHSTYSMGLGLKECSVACEKGFTCAQLFVHTDDDKPTTKGMPTCMPEVLGYKTAVSIDDDSLFYFSMASEKEYNATLKTKVECLKKKSEVLDKMEHLDLSPRLSPFGMDETDAFYNHRSNPTDGDFYPLCAVKVDVKGTNPDGEVKFKQVCRRYIGYREILNPVMLIPLDAQIVVIGFNGIGNFTIVSHPIHCFLKDFEKSFGGKVDTSKVSSTSNDPICDPLVGTGPRQSYASSFNGLRSGWFFPPEMSAIDPSDTPQLVIVGDGGQWYSSRITLDLEHGYYSEEPIYQGFRRF